MGRRHVRCGMSEPLSIMIHVSPPSPSGGRDLQLLV